MKARHHKIQIPISVNHTDKWSLASLWIKSNPVLINCIAAQYIPHMGCSPQDLKSEALLVAYQTISSLLQSEKDLSLMAQYFRVVFRSHCVHLTMRVPVMAGVDPEKINDTSRDEIIQQELDQHIIDATLTSLTTRQRQVVQWILNQPSPVNINLVGEHFGISARGVRRLISDAITRIENGHRNVCQPVSAFS